ncbi:MAG: S9 family peptidase, partial [Gammaproteobacteria bacterium]|nr:S9 family peptidase [Gammaproteobacteria bacterium]
MTRLLALALLTIVAATTALANDNYREPDPALTALVDAPLQPTSAVSPDKRWLAAFEYKWVKPLEEVARDELKLAGIRIDPVTFSRSRSTLLESIVLHDLESGEKVTVEGLPEGGRVASPSWSSDSARLAFLLEHGGKHTLWLYDVADDAVRQLSDE